MLLRGEPAPPDAPLIAVCGCPRSGHTLTYQLITQGLRVHVTDNFQYMLHRTPLVAHWLSRVVCRPYVSDYKSDGGYIRGLSGPQQAYLIWNYWCDMDQFERPPRRA